MVMRQLPSLVVTFAVAALLLATHAADSAPNVTMGTEPSDPIVVRVGSSVVESSRIAKGFARLHDFQRRQFGATPKAQLRGYVEQVTTRDLLLTERGRKSGMLESSRVSAVHKLLLEQALTDVLRKRLERESPVTDVDVKGYYDAHPELFQAPERIRIFRLLVDSEAEASALIERVKRLSSMDDWRNLVREKSKDKATSERGGDLGFVAADGTTDVPELEVDRTLFAAARGAKDGDVVRQPVPEGKRFAVVWRRGSSAAKLLDLRRESPRIRQLLANERVDLELENMIARLRQEHLHGRYPERLEGRDFPQPSEALAQPAVSLSAAPIPVTAPSRQ
jgi:peptidyl-prolyl cis-trans isomerase C